MVRPRSGDVPPAIVAILGPTASGKSAVAMDLAALLPAEIVACDSMQVYRGMDVGTGKATAAERAAVRHHLLDVVDPPESFHAAAWAEMARTAIGQITQRGQLPLVVGGTGLYFRALVKGLFEAPPSDPAIRARHQQQAQQQGVEALHQALAQIDPEAAAGILPNDLVRVSRALEIFEQTGMTITRRRQDAIPPPPLRVFSIVLDPSMDELRGNIGTRVDAMMAKGFLEEVAALRQRAFGAARALAGLGYRQLGQHLDGALALGEAVAETKRVTVAYARRQRTWFRKDPSVVRLPAVPQSAEALAALASHISQWRDTS